MEVGFIGLGIMGSRMAANLQKSGYQLTVYNRTPGKANDLVAQGAVEVQTAAEAARRGEVVITMLSTPQVVEETALSADGFLDAMQPNSIWIDCSTVNPTFSRQMAMEANRRGIRFLDAPVAGSKVPAERGELTILVGGDEPDVEVCRGIFEAVGQRTIHAGGHGMGSALKMVFNLLLGSSMVAFSEGMVLGEALGLEQARLFDILSNAIVIAPFVFGKRGKIENENYDADFPLQWMQKDLQLASVSAYEQGVPLPAVNVIKEVYAQAIRDGLGEQDFSAIYAYFRRGLKV
jgi:3-hydroxyisobutyrate dehydrogenase/glyoxylate/succinic semialdehyde reductase